MDTLRITERASANLDKGARRSRGGIILPPSDKLLFNGVFTVEHWRGGKRIDCRTFPNQITIEGKNHALDSTFGGGTQLTAWYIGLVDNAGFSALTENDTYDNIDQVGNGWDEFTDYTDPANSDSTTSRPEWTVGSASSKSITNSVPVVFDITGSGTVKGPFIAAGTNAQTKGDHTGSGNVLWTAVLFSGGDVLVENLDSLKVTYTINS